MLYFYLSLLEQFLFFETLSLYVCAFMLISLKHITDVVHAHTAKTIFE